jgi:CHASE2 domain-containing sensor protein
VEKRLRWIGVILLLLVGIAGIFLGVRYFGLRYGWWTTLLPIRLGLLCPLLAFGKRCAFRQSQDW